MLSEMLGDKIYVRGNHGRSQTSSILWSSIAKAVVNIDDEKTREEDGASVCRVWYMLLQSILILLRLLFFFFPATIDSLMQNWNCVSARDLVCVGKPERQVITSLSLSDRKLERDLDVNALHWNGLQL